MGIPGVSPFGILDLQAGMEHAYRAESTGGRIATFMSQLQLTSLLFYPRKAFEYVEIFNICIKFHS